jgi:hypothetical protein
MRLRNPLRPFLVALLAVLCLFALAERASAQTVVSDPLPDLGSREVAVRVVVDSSAGRDLAAEANVARERARIRHDLASARRRHLAMLRRYANAMAFPINRDQPGRLNVFIDDEGHICAAANLIARDGQRELVEQTAALDNNVRLVEVVGGPLMDWMLTSGFTQEEIGRIQEPYEYIDAELPQRDYQQELEDEKRRVRAVLLSVAAQLERDSAASLDVATERLLAARMAARAATPATTAAVLAPAS